MQERRHEVLKKMGRKFYGIQEIIKLRGRIEFYTGLSDKVHNT